MSSLEDVYSEEKFKAIKASPKLSTFPVDVQKIFKETRSFFTFVVQTSIEGGYPVSNDELAKYFLSDSESDHEERIGASVQNVESVFVQEIEPLGAEDTLADLQRLRTEYLQKLANVDNAIAKLKTKVNRRITRINADVQTALRGIDQKAMLLAQFDTYISSQMTIRRDLGLSAQPFYRLLDWLYKCYLTKEPPSFHSGRYLNLPLQSIPERTPSFRDFEGGTPPSDNFHDLVGRRFLVYNSEEGLELEDNELNQAVIEPIRRTFPDASVIFLLPVDFISKNLGSTVIYRNENTSAKSLYLNLLGEVRKYFDFNADRYIQVYSILIDALVKSKLIQFLRDGIEDPHLATDINTMKRIQTEIDRRELSILYRQYLRNEDGIDAFQEKVRNTFLRFYGDRADLFLYRSSGLTQRLLNTLPVLNESDEALQVIRAYRFNGLRFTIPPTIEDGPIMYRQAIHRCVQRTIGFFSLLQTPSQFIEFLSERAVSNDSSIPLTVIRGRSGLDTSGFLPAKTMFNPLKYVTKTQTREEAERTVYIYFLQVELYTQLLRHNPLKAPPTLKIHLETQRNDINSLQTEIRTLMSDDPDYTSIVLADVLRLNEVKSTMNLYNNGVDNVVFTRTSFEETLGEYTRRTHSLAFLGAVNDAQIKNIERADTLDTTIRESVIFRVQRLFDVLFDVVRGPERNIYAILTYIFSRFIERYQGIDVDNNDHTFEAWATTNEAFVREYQFATSIDAGVGGRIKDLINFASVRWNDRDADDCDWSDNRFLSTWAYGDINEDIVERETEYLSRILQIDTSISDPAIFDYQLRSLTNLNDTHLLFAFFSVLLQTWSMIAIDPSVKWTDVKVLLYELHPTVIRRLLLFKAIHSESEVQLPRFALRTISIDSITESLNVNKWTSGIEYVESLKYLDDVKTQVYGLFDVRSSEAVNTLIATLDARFFDLWLSAFPTGFVQTKINEIFGIITKVYTAPASTVRPFPQTTVVELSRLYAIFNVRLMIDDFLTALANLDVLYTLHGVGSLKSVAQRGTTLDDVRSVTSDELSVFQKARDFELEDEEFLDAYDVVFKLAVTTPLIRDIIHQHLDVIKKYAFAMFSKSQVVDGIDVEKSLAGYQVDEPALSIANSYITASSKFIELAMRYKNNVSEGEKRAWLQLIFNESRFSTQRVITERLRQIISAFYSSFIATTELSHLSKAKYAKDQIPDIGELTLIIQWIIVSNGADVNKAYSELNDILEFMIYLSRYYSMIVRSVNTWLGTYSITRNPTMSVLHYMTLALRARTQRDIYAYFYSNSTEILPSYVSDSARTLLSTTTDTLLRRRIREMFLDTQFIFDQRDLDFLLQSMISGFYLYPHEKAQMKYARVNCAPAVRASLITSLFSNFTARTTREEMLVYFMGVSFDMARQVNKEIRDTTDLITVAFLQKFLKIVADSKLISNIVTDEGIVDQAARYKVGGNLNVRAYFDKAIRDRIVAQLKTYWDTKLFAQPKDGMPVQFLVEGTTLLNYGVHKYLTLPIINSIRAFTTTPTASSS
jgi:hypothetical protein